MPAISIIVPVFNVKKDYLMKCFKSISNQSFTNIEVVIVDDGSTKECASICDDYAFVDERFRIIHQENKGVSVARNRGLLASTGKYVLYVDADDILQNRTCQFVHEIMEKYEDDILYFQFTNREKELHENSINSLEHKRLNGSQLETFIIDIILENESIENYCLGSPWGKAFKRSFLIENNLLFIEGLKKMEDRLFMLYCLNYHPQVSFSNFIGYYYNIYDDSVSMKIDKQIVTVMDKVINEVNKFNKKFHSIPYELMIQLYINLFFKCLYSDCLHIENRENLNNKSHLLKKLSHREPYNNAIYSVSIKSLSAKRAIIICLLRYRLYRLIIISVSLKNKKIIGVNNNEF